MCRLFSAIISVAWSGSSINREENATTVLTSCVWNSGFRFFLLGYRAFPGEKGLLQCEQHRNPCSGLFYLRLLVYYFLSLFSKRAIMLVHGYVGVATCPAPDMQRGLLGFPWECSLTNGEGEGWSNGKGTHTPGQHTHSVAIGTAVSLYHLHLSSFPLP